MSTKFASGGYVDSDKLSPIISTGCDYVIPWDRLPVSVILDMGCVEFASKEVREKKLRELLDRLNESVLD